MEKKESLKTKIPAIHRKSWIMGFFGAAIGGGIGGYLSAIKGADIYAGIGAGVGSVLGGLIGVIIGPKISLQSLIATERIINIILGLLCFCVAIAGVVGFILTRKWVGILGAIFFSLCGIYLLRRRD